MNKEKQANLQNKLTLISCSREINDLVVDTTKKKTVEKVDNILSPIQEAFHIIQHDLNALHVKARLMKAGVPIEILDKIIPQYEAMIHPLIYPLIKE